MSLAEVVAAAGDATLDGFLWRLQVDLKLDWLVGIEESDRDPGLVITLTPLSEPSSPVPAWTRTTSVDYPTSLADIYETVRQLRPTFFGLSGLDVATENDALTDPTAAALHLIRTLGISPGGSAGAAHYGATTLLVRHLRVLQKDVRFSFIAHHGVHMDLRTDDRLTRQIAQTYTAGKRPSQRMFDTTPKKVNAFLQEFVPAWTVKDLRTLRCSTLAEEEIARIDEQWECPQNAEQLQRYMRDVAKFVASKVGNRWQIHLEWNINPALFDHWRAAAGAEAEV
jgi:hypothetical protein